jgi:hypothetical protein
MVVTATEYLAKISCSAFGGGFWKEITSFEITRLILPQPSKKSDLIFWEKPPFCCEYRGYYQE